MKRILPLFLILIMLCVTESCKTGNSSDSSTEDADTSIVPTATLLWKTDTTFTGSESALYYPAQDIIFVSCGNTSPTEKDGNGFIARIRRDGSVENINWTTGLHAPKGMAILGGSLFVTDIDEMVEIDLKDGSILNHFPVEGAGFLNDSASDDTYVYFSDMGTAKVYRMKDGNYETVAENVSKINGLETYGGSLYGLNADGLIRFDGSGGFDILYDNILGGDGLVIIDENTFIASLWGGEVFYIDGDQITKIIDTRDEDSKTADIYYIEKDRMILVPTFFKNELAAYQLDL